MPKPKGRLHFLTAIWSRPQRAFVRRFHRYFERAPDWVLLTTRGRRTGLPREVLLPCRRLGDDIVVLSAYGLRSDWMKNLIAGPRVEVTCNGRRRSARAEVVDDVARKRELLAQDPFLLSMPFALVQALVWTLLRPLYFALAWPIVASRPLVIAHIEDLDGDRPLSGRQANTR
jgi:deazaflavin-dependent oxidoreductase (nitroreductase family)